MSEYPTIDIRIHKANKKHYCEDASCTKTGIGVGEKYVVMKFIDRENYPDTVQTFKIHVNCLEFVGKSDISEVLEKKGILFKEHTDGYCRLVME